VGATSIAFAQDKEQPKEGKGKGKGKGKKGGDEKKDIR
jgi:hypothetical protein